MNRVFYFFLLAILFPSVSYPSESFFVIVEGNEIGEVELSTDKNRFPCFSKEQLVQWGVITPEQVAELTTKGCLNAREIYFLNISVNLIKKVNILTFSFLESVEAKPDHLLEVNNRDYGIPAIMLNYDWSYKKYDGRRYIRRNKRNILEAELNAGINYRQWRIRSTQSYDNEEIKSQRFSFSDLYAERDISSINSRLHIGDGYNNSFYLPSFPYRGVRLASDDTMFPSSQGFILPWVYGVASSDAEVVITQNGHTVYRTMVSPGEFFLKNIKLLDKTGSISMIVKESDGGTNYYNIPWSNLDNIIDKNSWKYDISLGRFRTNERNEEGNPFFFQGGGGYGISATNSLYSGILVAKGYQNISIGVGQRLNKYGDVIVNYQHSRVTLDQDNHIMSESGIEEENNTEKKSGTTGEKLHLQYAVNAPQINTSITFNSEYNLRSNFNDFNDFSYNYVSRYFCCSFYETQYKLNLAINSSISSAQSLTLNVNQEKYKKNSGMRILYALSYMHNASTYSFDIDGSYHQFKNKKNEMMFGIRFRIPLKKLGVNNTSVSLGYTYDPFNHYQTEIGLSGRHLDNNFNYRTTAKHGKKNSMNYNANAYYRYRSGEANGRYSSGKDYTFYSVQSSGSLIAHQGGITLGQTLGETNALVYTKNHPNTAIPEQVDVITDNRGYAIISNLIPYQINIVKDDFSQEIDFSDDIDDSMNEVKKVPTLGGLSYYELVN